MPVENDATRALSIYIDPVNDGPSGITPTTLPTIPEDSGASEATITWTDVDFDPGSSRYRVELARPNLQSVVVASPMDLAGRGVVTVVDDDDTDLEALLRFVPDANWHGTATFWVRAVDDSAGDEVAGPWRLVTVTVTPVADAPTAPVGDMPTVKPGKVSIGRFTSTDPDGGPWQTDVAADPSGPWASNVTLANGTIITAIDNALSYRIRARNTVPGVSVFWTRVRDVGDSLTSPSTRVELFIGNPSPEAEIAELIRTTSTAAIRNLGPAPIISMRITEAEQGPGSADVVLNAAAIQRLADDENKTIEELLSPGGLEMHIRSGGDLVHAGRIVDWSMNAELTTVRCEVAGLAEYFETAAVEGATPLSYVAEQPDDLMWDLVSYAQGLDYGNLLITRDTDPFGDPITIDVTPGTSIAAALQEVTSQLRGPAWWVTPQRQFRTAAFRGVDRREELLLTDAVAVLDVAGRSDEVATVVEVVGVDAADDPVLEVAEAAPSVLARLGRIVVRMQAPGVVTPAQALAMAEQVLEDRLRVSTQGTLTHYPREGGVGPFDYSVGDALLVEQTTPVGLRVRAVRILDRNVSVSEDSWVVSCQVEVIGIDEPLRPSRVRLLPDLYEATGGLR